MRSRIEYYFIRDFYFIIISNFPALSKYSIYLQGMKTAKAYTLILVVFFCTAFLLAPKISYAKNPDKTRILIILDCSGSMYSKFGKADRITAAKKILIHLVDSMRKVPNVQLALRCYGHQHAAKEHDCKDSKLEIPFGDNNADEIVSFVKQVKPNGWTPIAYSLTEAASDFPDSKERNVIMLITDGLEECDGDPCAASKALLEKKVTLQPFIIGIGLTDKMMKEFDCVGKNYNPKNEKDFGRVVSGVISQALDNTTVQVQLLDEKKMPYNTNVPMVFTGNVSAKSNAYFMHTLDAANKPDTFSIDPNYTYDLKIFSVPMVEQKNIPLQIAHHNIISLNVPMGYLSVNAASYEYNNVSCLVRRAGSTDIINVQNMNSWQRYLSGLYDIEVLCMPRIKIKNVSISGSEPGKVQVPDPGKLELNYKGDEVIGSVYVLRDQKQEWLFDFKGSLSTKKEIYLLQPGKYLFIYRPLKSTTVLDTHAEKFNIYSGQSTSMKTE